MKFTIMVMLLACSTLLAQGPPITGDKPIMLGKGRGVVKTLTEIRQLNDNRVNYVPLIAHYLPSPNTLIGGHIPAVISENGNTSLGDVALLGKYQFYKKDKTGNTFRMALKSFQKLPTGDNLGIPDISLGKYQALTSIILGKESIQHGILFETGYNVVSQSNLSSWQSKLAFGLPLLKPKFPLKQINLYFEYNSKWYTSVNEYVLLYDQGLQYAYRQMTFDLAVQVPIIQDVAFIFERKYSLFLGSRYVF